MRLDCAAQTHKGLRKSNNEDAYGVFGENTPDLKLFDEGALLCVADGLGGHAGGEIASKLAVSYVKDTLKSEQPERQNTSNDDKGPLPVLRDGFEKANQSICQTNQDLVRGDRPMGTTLLAALVTPREAYVANVGDSRCYLIRQGEIAAKTEDHSWVDEQVKLGLMSEEEAETDNRKNIVTRSIGTHPEVEVDTYVWRIEPGDVLLLCTDGLINMVKEADILAEFNKSAAPAEIANRLVDLANQNGGKDNITVIVATVEPRLIRLYWLRWLSFWRKNKTTLLWLGACLLFGALTFTAGYFLGRLAP